jgi:hypothetical protein
MKGIAISLLLVGPALNGCAGGEPTASMSSLPVAARQALLELCAPCEFADYDGSWNSTDFLDGRPQRHLKKTVQTASGWLIEYEHGGRAQHGHVVVFELEPRIQVVAGSSCVPAPGVECEW